MTGFKCPCCGAGNMIVEVLPDHVTKLGGIPVRVKDAEIARCDHCGETSVSAPEMARWEQVQKAQLQDKLQVPSPREVRSVRESFGLTVSDFAALLGVTRQTVYAWERADTGGMQLGPAALVVKLLGEEIAGRMYGIAEWLVSAAQERGHELTLAVTGEGLISPEMQSVAGTREPTGLRCVPEGGPGFAGESKAA